MYGGEKCKTHFNWELGAREGEELEVVIDAGTAECVPGRLDVDVGKGVDTTLEVDVART